LGLWKRVVPRGPTGLGYYPQKPDLHWSWHVAAFLEPIVKIVFWLLVAAAAAAVTAASLLLLLGQATR